MYNFRALITWWEKNTILEVSTILCNLTTLQIKKNVHMTLPINVDKKNTAEFRQTQYDYFFSSEWELFNGNGLRSGQTW